MAKSSAERNRVWRNKIVTKQCIACGREFQTVNHGRGVCEECKVSRRQEARPQTFLVCQHCGQQFGPVDHLGRKYCSLTCKRADLRGKPTAKRGRRFPHTERARAVLCPGCGSQFRAVKDTVRRRQLYCSHTCYLRCRGTSHFEQRVMDMLIAAGVSLERQAKRGRWTFDAALTDTTILVEADGSYWHSSEAVQTRDARKDAWCVENGYILMRVREMDFYRDSAAAVNVILRRWEAETGREATLLERADERQEAAHATPDEVHA